VAGARGIAEVALPIEGGEILELAQLHAVAR
jgi:hypothetical protein